MNGREKKTIIIRNPYPLSVNVESNPKKMGKLWGGYYKRLGWKGYG